MTTQTAVAPYGWLRNAPFDLGFIVGIAALAVASGYVVVLNPTLFPLVLFLDIYLLGYHHVVSTFTRLAFDKESFLEHRFLVVWLPLLVLAAAVSAVMVVGGWVLSTTYLYWQWFHYTRQSYGIERVYRAQGGRRRAGGQRSPRRPSTGAAVGHPLSLLSVPGGLSRRTGQDSTRLASRS